MTDIQDACFRFQKTERKVNVMSEVNKILSRKQFYTVEEAKDYLLNTHDSDSEIDQNSFMCSIARLDLSDEEIDELFDWCEQNGIVFMTDSDDEADQMEQNEEDLTLEDEITRLEQAFAQSSRITTLDSVKSYLKNIGQYSLLNAEQEKEAAMQVQEGLQAEEILRTLDEDLTAQELRGLSEEEINYRKELQKKIELGETARKILIVSNLRLVVSNAKKYTGGGLLLADLIQEGNIGLMKAVKKFDYTKGFKFSTYATWWIKQAITRAIADQSHIIRIPVHMVETINKLKRIQRQLVQNLGRDPLPEEIAEKMGNMTPEKVLEIQTIAADPVSLETPIGEEEDSHLGDFIEDKITISPDSYVRNQSLRDEIEAILSEFPIREQQVIRMRFGLDDNKSRTLEDVGERFNVTRERIRQIEAKALKRFKSADRKQRLKDFLDS